MKHKNPLYRSPATRHAKHDKRWTLLFIGSHGKTITFYRLKEAMIVAALILILIGVAFGILTHLYRNTAHRYANIQEKMSNLNKVLNDLRNENEVLLARLVVAESRVEENIQMLKEDADAQTKEAVSATETIKNTPVKPRQRPLTGRVKIDDFMIYHKPDVNTLQVSYKVINSGPKNENVAGRTVVVLKTRSANPSNWLVLPDVPLKKGRPTGKYGKRFSIFKFRTMKFQANDQTGPHKFNTGIVYVFSNDGELLFEKNFPVGIKTQVITAPKKRVKKTSIRKEKEPESSHPEKGPPPSTDSEPSVAEKPAKKPVSSPLPSASDENSPTDAKKPSAAPDTQEVPSFQLQIPSADPPNYSLPEPAETTSNQPNPNPANPRHDGNAANQESSNSDENIKPNPD